MKKAGPTKRSIVFQLGELERPRYNRSEHHRAEMAFMGCRTFRFGRDHHPTVEMCSCVCRFSEFAHHEIIDALVIR